MPAIRPNPRRRGRSLGVRARTEFPAVIHDGARVTHCRTVELSATGVLLEGASACESAREEELVRLELFVPDRDRPVRALARWIRVIGTRHALHFVAISDADRLTLMEHVDRLTRLAG